MKKASMQILCPYKTQRIGFITAKFPKRPLPCQSERSHWSHCSLLFLRSLWLVLFPLALYIHSNSWFMNYFVFLFQHDSSDSASIGCNGIVAFLSLMLQFNFDCNQSLYPVFASIVFHFYFAVCLLQDC